MKLPLKLNNNNNVFWSMKKFLSYGDALSTLIAIGGRGIGKTTSAFITAANQFNKNGTQFVLVRRYKAELKKFVTKRSLDYVYDGIKYKSKDEIFMFDFEDDTVGYGIPLSTATDFKSVDFSRVGFIIYDEATLIRKGMKRYLENEVVQLLELYSTIARLRPNVKLVILGNNVDLYNPYFEYFNVPVFDTIYVDKKRGLMCELPRNSSKLMELEKSTALYKLTAGTQYAKYHYENELLVSKKVEILKEPPQVYSPIKIGIKKYTLSAGFYIDKTDRLMRLYISSEEKVDKSGTCYQIITPDGNRNYYYMEAFRNTFRGPLTRMFYNDKCTYDKQITADIFATIMEEL